MTVRKATSKKRRAPAGRGIRKAPGAAELRGRAAVIVQRLDELYEAKTELHFTSPLECAVATILSAQCTDRRVNEVTRDLFQKYRTAADYAAADPEVLEQEIRPTGYFRQKTKSLIKLGQALVDRHGGRLPDTMESLTELPGIGRKTANVILSAAFGKDEGVVVDTHVKRVANRLGLTRHSDPDKIEADLTALVPRRAWGGLGLRLILHGRRVCAARKPKCAECVLEDVCPSAHVFG